MIFSEEQYDLFGKYDCGDAIAFDVDELTFLYKVLNIGWTPEFREELLSEYIKEIQTETNEQNRALTHLFSRFLILKEQKSHIEAYSGLLEKIGVVRSMYMLEVLVSFVSHQNPQNSTK